MGTRTLGFLPIGISSLVFAQTTAKPAETAPPGSSGKAEEAKALLACVDQAGMLKTRRTPNGHKQPVSPMKRIMMRNLPELTPELDSVVNAFDPWARDRGEYYSLAWKPRPGAESDEAFAAQQ